MISEKEIRLTVDKIFDRLAAGKIPKARPVRKPRKTKKNMTDRQRKLYHKLIANGINREEALACVYQGWEE